tara:strand:+ start:124 stop:1686 length:1563 start_codon:yes stop_codon:yes gene_type:complete
MKKTGKGFKTNKHFFEKGAKHLGFGGLGSLLEMVDNPIDADANLVNIKYQSDKFKKTKQIVIEDNGRGFEPSNFETAILTWGDTRQYTSTDIGNFGIGMSAVFNEVVQSGGEIKIETSDGKIHSEGTLYKDDKIDEVLFPYEQNDAPNGIPHTKIVMNSVKTDLTIDNVIKNLKVIYYPKFADNPDFKIVVEGDKNKEIRFVDPMYRDLPDEQNVCKTYHHKFNFKGHDIDIFARAFYTGFSHKYKDRIEKDSWDKNSSGWLPKYNSGLYLRYNGRYINVGNMLMPGNSHGGHHFIGLRFEIQIPKTIQDFPINVNKSKVNLDKDNSDLQDLYRTIKELKAEYNRDYLKTKGSNSTTTEEELQQIQDFVNKLVQDSGILKPLMNRFGGNNGIQKRTRTNIKKGTKRPKNTGIKRSGHQLPKAFEPNVIKNGINEPFYTWDDSSQTAVLILNQDSELYKFWLKQGIEALGCRCFELYCERYAIKGLSEEAQTQERKYQILQDNDEIVSSMTKYSNRLLKSS